MNKIAPALLTLACLLILNAPTKGQAPSTTRLDVQIITDEAEAVLKILEEKASGREITEADWQAVFTSEGYTRLQKRERSLKRPFEDSTFRNFILTDSVVQKRKAFAETLARWKEADVTAIAALSFAYLPESSRIRAKVYPVIKPRSNNFVFEYPGDPAIFLYLDPAAGRKRFETILAHELHHIGFGSGCASEKQKEKTRALPANLQKVTDWLGSLGEGFATLAAAGSPDINPYAGIYPEDIDNWNKDVAGYNTHLRTLEQFFLDLAAGRLPDEQISKTGFSFFGVAGRSGLWYVVGWQMGVVIEKTFGRKKLVEVICNRSRLLSTYNKAVKKYNRKNNTRLSAWSKELANQLK